MSYSCYKSHCGAGKAGDAARSSRRRKPLRRLATRNSLTVFPIASADGRAFDAACSDMLTGRLSLFDTLLLAAARAAGGTLLLSDGMQDGAGFGGLVVRNPLRGERLPADLVLLLGFG